MPTKDIVRLEHCCGGEAKFHVYAADRVDKEESVRRMGSEEAMCLGDDGDDGDCKLQVHVEKNVGHYKLNVKVVEG